MDPFIHPFYPYRKYRVVLALTCSKLRASRGHLHSRLIVLKYDILEILSLLESYENSVLDEKYCFMGRIELTIAPLSIEPESELEPEHERWLEGYDIQHLLLNLIIIKIH
ncbi:hypothetical protein MJO29_016983 [Puccinia striiformis f. sp. tritici]|nr:hypothetical protein MJO29_016983 [Puccinia striiformis f. sp. tritici]